MHNAYFFWIWKEYKYIKMQGISDYHSTSLCILWPCIFFSLTNFLAWAVTEKPVGLENILTTKICFWVSFFSSSSWPLRGWSVLEFWTIKLEKSSSMNWIFSLQKSISKLIFAGYTGSKNPVGNRLKIQFIELVFSKLIFQKSSTDQQGVKLLRQENWFMKKILTLN